MGSLTLEDGDEVLPTTMTPLTMDDFEGILSKYIGNQYKLALLLDYDGTLAPIAPHPDLATIPTETKKVSRSKDYRMAYSRNKMWARPLNRFWNDLQTCLTCTLPLSLEETLKM